MVQAEFNEGFYKMLNIAGNSAVRPYFEEGNLRVAPDVIENRPIAQVIQGKSEHYSRVGQANISVVELPFCLENKDLPLRLKLQYHSTFFNYDNFYTKKTYQQNINTDILGEMDSIVESIFLFMLNIALRD